MTADRLIALSERLEQREVRHDVRLTYIDVYANGARLGIVDYHDAYKWQGGVLHSPEAAALVIALDVANAEINAEPARSPRRSGRTPRAHHRRTYTDPNGRKETGT